MTRRTLSFFAGLLCIAPHVCVAQSAVDTAPLRNLLTRLATSPLPDDARQTAVTLLAFHSAGQPPHDGRFGMPVTNLTAHLLTQLPLAPSQDTPTCSIVLLALTQALAVEPDGDRAARLRAAIGNLLPTLLTRQSLGDATAAPGGFFFAPGKPSPDLTASAWAVFALRAAHTAGFSVPRDRFSAALRFALLCQTHTGGFASRPGFSSPDAPTDFSLTAAGALLLAAAQPPGTAKPPELDTALATLLTLTPARSDPDDALFFAVVALSTVSDPAALRYRDALVPQGDALAALCLTAPWRVLPAYPPLPLSPPPSSTPSPSARP